MGVYTRPNSPYLCIKLPGRKGARWTTDIPKDGGTPKQTAENWKLAQSIYNVRIGDNERVQYDLPPRERPTARTFKQQRDWYAEHHTSKHRGALSETRKLERLGTFFDSYALEAITPRLWTEYETERMTTDKVARNTVGRELAIMKCVLNSAVGEYIEFHRLGQVKRTTTKLAAKRTITAEEEESFLAALRRIDPELADMYLVGVGTLLRQEALVYLQRSEYRGDRLALQTKTGPHQLLLTGPTALQRRAHEVLKRRLPTKPDGFFFPRWKATFLPYDDPGHPGVLLRKKVQRAAKAAGLPWGLKNGGIVWHTATRASGATRMIREYGIDVRTVQLIGGWKSLDQMAEYLGLALDLANVAGKRPA
jgi:integrase